MNILSRKQFIARKTRDTIAIMGNGYSINTITHDEWTCIDGMYDTFGLNWWCHAGRNTTFYLVREQCVSMARIEKGGKIHDFLKEINAIKTTLVVKNKLRKKHDIYLHQDHLDRFKNDGYVFDEPKSKHGVDMFGEDIFTFGLIHRFSLCDAMHFATSMGYGEIAFFGIDLYDQRYFWLGPAETKQAVAYRKQTYADPHATADRAVGMMQEYQILYPDIRLSVHNPKSRLAEVVPVWEKM